MMFFNETKIEITFDKGGEQITLTELITNHELEIILPDWYGDEVRISKRAERIYNEYKN